MKSLPFVIATILGWLSASSSASTSDSGLTDLVRWDDYSLIVDGSRVFINSAEFHYARLPVPELWDDVLQKFKANGFNSISIYLFWSYHSPSRGVFDFETPGKNIQRLFDAAKEAGLWVIARAGPYCNAETNGGGLALYGADGSFGRLRSGDETFHQAWKPWVSAVGKIIAANQITNGGPVILNQIENELTQTGAREPNNTLVVYMEQVKAAFREAGVVVPFTANEKGLRGPSWTTDYQDVGGSADLYGVDHYPGNLSCTDPSAGFKVHRTYFPWLEKYAFTQPSFMPEFEGGWFSGWGGTFYDQCESEHDPAFADVYYKNNIGQRVTMQNIYMTYGGTNWGHSAAPVVYTSYDYSAPLRETRQQWPKVFQTKLVNMFSSSSPDLLKTDMVGYGPGFQVSSPSIFSWVLKNPDTGAAFTVVQQNNTASTADVAFTARLNTSEGAIEVADISLDGRQSKILVTDYSFGQNRTLLYCSADIATHATFGDGDDVLVLYLKEGQTGRFAFGAATGAAQQSDDDITFTVFGDSTVAADPEGSTGGRGFSYVQGTGKTSVRFSNGVLLYLLDQPSAWHLWAPATTTYPAPGPGDSLFVQGPYLTRAARIDGSTLKVTGDNDVAVELEAYVGSERGIDAIEWNGVSLPVTKTPHGAWVTRIPGAEDRAVSLPSLEEADWLSADSLPETAPGFDDSGWTECDRNTTLNPVAPPTLPVLYSSDYGFHAGAKIYRAYFSGTEATGASLTCSGGNAFGWSAWLNGVFVGGHPGNATAATSTVELDFPPAAFSAATANEAGDTDDITENVLTVLVDYSGHDQASQGRGLYNPRGILSASLKGPAGTNSTFRAWKLQGSAGVRDPVRGPMNEGGLFAERMGWHLPGFPASSSPDFHSSSSPLDGLSGPGVRFYLANFTLSIDADLDAPLGVELSSPPATVARVMPWVNGYQYGKYLPHVGPQTRFPVPPGVLRTRGLNTLALSLWAPTEAGARLDRVGIFGYGVYQSGFEGFGRDMGETLRPPWGARSD